MHNNNCPPSPTEYCMSGIINKLKIAIEINLNKETEWIRINIFELQNVYRAEWRGIIVGTREKEVQIEHVT